MRARGRTAPRARRGVGEPLDDPPAWLLARRFLRRVPSRPARKGVAMQRRIVVGRTRVALGAVAPIGAAKASTKPPTNGGDARRPRAADPAAQPHEGGTMTKRIAALTVAIVLGLSGTAVAAP